MTLFELNFLGITIAPTYYGLMYVLAFFVGYSFLLHKKTLSKDHLESLFLYMIFGVILGGRIGYILFYDLGYYIQNLEAIFKIWEGGMSFHGGFLGSVVAVGLFSYKNKLNFYKVIDEIALIAPLGIFFGRIGNYINKELLGKEYSGLFAVEKNGISYFPSPLLEAFLEGIILFIICYFVYKKRTFYGQIGIVFLIGYGVFRTFVELFIRLPDPQIGYIFGDFLTVGSLLSFPMVIIGGILYVLLKQKNKIGD